MGNVKKINIVGIDDSEIIGIINDNPNSVLIEKEIDDKIIEKALLRLRNKYNNYDAIISNIGCFLNCTLKIYHKTNWRDDLYYQLTDNGKKCIRNENFNYYL